MEFKSYIKLPGGGETTRCFYPVKVDTYGCGCSHNCLYCYARSVLHFRNLWNELTPNRAEYWNVQHIFKRVFDDHKASKWSTLLRRRMPIRMGGMTDCFNALERKHRVSWQFLKTLRRLHYPYQIFTKSAMVAEPAYLDVLRPELAYIQFSITTPYEDVAAVYEPGASSVAERLVAMKTLSDKGFYVAGRINPLFPLYPDGHFSRGVDGDGLRYFDWSLVDLLADHGCKTLIAGFVRLSSWNLRWIKERTGDDLTRLFDPALKQANAALHFGSLEKRYYYERLRDAAHQRGMAFSICYDGDDAYAEFHDLWDNPADCCNAVGNVPGFQVKYDAFNPAFTPLG